MVGPCRQSGRRVSVALSMFGRQAQHGLVFGTDRQRPLAATHAEDEAPRRGHGGASVRRRRVADVAIVRVAALRRRIVLEPEVGADGRCDRGCHLGQRRSGFRDRRCDGSGCDGRRRSFGHVRGDRQLRSGGAASRRMRTLGATWPLRGARRRRRSRGDHRGLRRELGTGSGHWGFGRKGGRAWLQPRHRNGLGGAASDRWIHDPNPAVAGVCRLRRDRLGRRSLDPAAVALHRAQMIDRATVLADPVLVPDHCLERKLLRSSPGGPTREGFPRPAGRSANGAEDQPQGGWSPEQPKDDGCGLEAHRSDPASRIRVITRRPPVRGPVPGLCICRMGDLSRLCQPTGG